VRFRSRQSKSGWEKIEKKIIMRAMEAPKDSCSGLLVTGRGLGAAVDRGWPALAGMAKAPEREARLKPAHADIGRCGVHGLKPVSVGGAG